MDSKPGFQDHEVEMFNEDEVVGLLRTSVQSSDEKLEMVSVWAESNGEMLKTANSIFDVFTHILRHIDTTNISQSAITKFLIGKHLFALNPDCRSHLKELSSNCRPQRLLIYGKTKDDQMAIISTVKEFTEDSQQVVNLRFSYFEGRGVGSLNGIIYLIGGMDTEYQRLATTTEIDIESGVVSEGPPMITARSSSAVTASSNEIFVCGGYNNFYYLNTCERLRPTESNSWIAMPSLTFQRDNAAAVVLGGDQQLLVAGGRVDGMTPLSSVELLNLQPQQSSEWIPVASMHQARYRHGMCLFRGRVVVASGWNGVGMYLNSAEMFSPPQATGDFGQWTELRPLSQIRDGWVSQTVWKDRLLTFGRFFGKIEELIDTGNEKNRPIEEIMPPFTWRLVGNLSENMKYVEGAVVVETKSN